MRLQAERPNHIWVYDFMQDADRYGNTLYILTVMDEFTREGLAIDVATETSVQGIVAVLGALQDVYDTPTSLRSDNGAEFVARALRDWLTQHNIQPLYIDPGCPWQNGKDERFNGTVRDECLNMHLDVYVCKKTAISVMLIAGVARQRVVCAGERPDASSFRHSTREHVYREYGGHTAAGWS